MTYNAAIGAGFNSVTDRIFIRQMEIANHFTDNNLRDEFNRHFNTNTSGIDSRIVAAMTELGLAEEAWNNGHRAEAALHLGQGLHSIQDMSAHVGFFGSTPWMHSVGCWFEAFGANPDNDMSRSATAFTNSEDYLLLFRSDVGLTNN